MWNSPNRSTRKGKQYRFEELPALTYCIGMLLDYLREEQPDDVLHESCLRRMEKEEFIYALYQVIDTLMNNEPVPKNGHFGYQEAIVSELLEQTYGHVEMELEQPDAGSDARRAAWLSLGKLLSTHHLNTPAETGEFLGFSVDFSDPKGFLSAELSKDTWREMITGESGLWSEFLWDTDWQCDFLLDMPPQAARKTEDAMGISLATDFALPHTPTRAEYEMATHYLQYISWRDEVLTNHLQI